MARIKNPKLFSTYYGVPSDALTRANLIDPLLDVDMPLFIDPVLFELSQNEVIRAQALPRFRQHFEVLVRLLTISEKENDAAWKVARKQLDLREPPENGLGYGSNSRSGNSRPHDVREKILRTMREIINLGAKDPEMISLMGFFEEDVGPDTISDLTTTVIMEDLASVTEYFCIQNGIPTYATDVALEHKLPRFINARGKQCSIVLVPTDIVRELPIANDWSDIERAAMENAHIRERVNRFLAGIITPTIVDRKKALRCAALSSPSDFDFFLSAVKENVVNYDPNLDALGYYRLKHIISNGFPGTKQDQVFDLSGGPEEMIRVVQATLMLFKQHVEVGNLWEELWVDGKPKKERASQLIYYAIADAFCKANDLDVSPEANMGGGPIDFKFSKGYKTRILVEMKRSSGTVVHGYEKQLEFYKDASQTDFAIFVVVDYGDLGKKLDEIKEIRRQRLNASERASEIVVVDATPKASASKRK